MVELFIITGVIMYSAGIYVGRNWDYFTKDE